MVQVVSVGVGEMDFFEHFIDLVAQSHSNILGRSSKVRATLLNLVTPPLCDQQILRKPPKRFKFQI